MPTAQEIERIVRRVIVALEARDLPSAATPSNPRGVYPTVAQCVEAARISQRALIACSLEKRRAIVSSIRTFAADQVHELARRAVDETGLGRVEDKIRKNLLVIHRTPGPEFLEPIAITGDDGLTLVERAPYGVIAAITPSTNPTETILCNGIGMVSGGNTVVFNTHPGAKAVSAFCVDLANRASIAAGGPDDVFTCVADPTLDTANELLRHPAIRMNVVTGGGGVVKAALAAGKRCVAGGPGNPPVVIDDTADLDAAARGVVAGASFDNNVICTDEKEVFVVERAFDRVFAGVQRHGAVRVEGAALARLEKLVLTADRAHTQTKWVGKDAGRFLREIDVPFQGDPRLVVAEVPFDHPFVQYELLMPILPFVRVRDVDEGIALAVRAEHGYGHTASMWSRDVDALHAMARAFDGSIFVKNAPNYAGLGFGGEGWTSFTIASPTGDGLTNVRTFTRERRCTLAGRFRIT